MRRLMLLCALLLTGAAAQAQSPTPITLKLSQFLGPGSFFAVDWAKPWAEELEARTNGRVKVEVYDGSNPFGAVTAQASQVKAGTIDIALGLRGAEGERFPRSSVAELPFIVPNSAAGSRALWDLYKQGAFGPEYQDFKLLALFVHNPGLIHTASKPVQEPADLRGLRLRAPNKAVALALERIGAVPAILQVNDVMPAVSSGALDGIVTNWGNPLPGFNDLMKFYTNVPFYTSVFFVVMNRERFASLPPEVQTAIDTQSNDALVARFGTLWTKWDAPVRAGADVPGHQIITPDGVALVGWQDALRPVTDLYLDELQTVGSFPEARDVFARLVAATRP